MGRWSLQFSEMYFNFIFTQDPPVHQRITSAVNNIIDREFAKDENGLNWFNFIKWNDWMLPVIVSRTPTLDILVQVQVVLFWSTLSIDFDLKINFTIRHWIFLLIVPFPYLLRLPRIFLRSRSMMVIVCTNRYIIEIITCTWPLVNSSSSVIYE